MPYMDGMGNGSYTAPRSSRPTSRKGLTWDERCGHWQEFLEMESLLDGVWDRGSPRNISSQFAANHAIGFVISYKSTKIILTSAEVPKR